MAKDMSLVKRSGHTSFNMYFKGSVPVKASQNIWIVKWLDFVCEGWQCVSNHKKQSLSFILLTIISERERETKRYIL